MTNHDLAGRLAALVDERVPVASADPLTASAVSALLATLAALRDDRLSSLARGMWEFFAVPEATPPCGQPWSSGEVEQGSMGGPLGLDELRWERFRRVWSRATSSDDPRYRRFADLWYKHFLILAENRELRLEMNVRLAQVRESRAGGS